MNVNFEINAGDRADKQYGCGFLRWRNTMKKYINLAAMLLLLGMCAAPLWAQLDGSIRGTVKGQDGKPLAGATVHDVRRRQTAEVRGSRPTARANTSSASSTWAPTKARCCINGTPIDEQNNVPIGGRPGAGRQLGRSKNRSAAGHDPRNSRRRSKLPRKQNEKIKGLNATLKQAKELEGTGNYDQAITMLQQAAQSDPNQDLVWALPGRCPAWRQEIPRRGRVISEGPGHQADHRSLHGPVGRCLRQVGTDRQGGAAVCGRRCWPIPPNAGSYYYNEGAVLTNTGKARRGDCRFRQGNPDRSQARRRLLLEGRRPDWQGDHGRTTR